MRTARERLEFAIHFAELDLDKLTPGGWLTLREELEAFHGYGPRSSAGGTVADLGGIVATPLNRPLPQEFSEDDFKKLQADVATLIRELATGNSAAFIQAPGTARGMAISTFAVNVRYAILPIRAGGIGVPLISFQGPTRDVTLLRLLHLLTGPGSRALRLCPEPDCGRVFYRVRRQEYCSKKCVNRANKRDARAKAANGEARRRKKPVAGKKPKRAR